MVSAGVFDHDVLFCHSSTVGLKNPYGRAQGLEALSNLMPSKSLEDDYLSMAVVVLRDHTPAPPPTSPDPLHISQVSPSPPDTSSCDSNGGDDEDDWFLEPPSVLFDLLQPQAPQAPQAAIRCAVQDTVPMGITDVWKPSVQLTLEAVSLVNADYNVCAAAADCAAGNVDSAATSLVAIAADCGLGADPCNTASTNPGVAAYPCIPGAAPDLAGLGAAQHAAKETARRHVYPLRRASEYPLGSGLSPVHNRNRSETDLLSLLDDSPSLYEVLGATTLSISDLELRGLSSPGELRSAHSVPLGQDLSSSSQTDTYGLRANTMCNSDLGLGRRSPSSSGELGSERIEPIGRELSSSSQAEPDEIRSQDWVDRLAPNVLPSQDSCGRSFQDDDFFCHCPLLDSKCDLLDSSGPRSSGELGSERRELIGRDLSSSSQAASDVPRSQDSCGRSAPNVLSSQNSCGRSFQDDDDFFCHCPLLDSKCDLLDSKCDLLDPKCDLLDSKCDPLDSKCALLVSKVQQMLSPHSPLDSAGLERYVVKVLSSLASSCSASETAAAAADLNAIAALYPVNLQPLS
eukprot:gene18869-25425_t